MRNRMFAPRFRVARRVYRTDPKELAMRLSPLFVVVFLAAGAPGCFNTNHPEYHPVTSLQYSQNVSSGVAVSPAPGGQPVYVVPANGATPLMQPPPPPPPPEPPENFPW
jgi:hypothetical protein